MKIRVSEQGLLIPKHLLGGVDEVWIWKKPDSLLVIPASGALPPQEAMLLQFCTRCGHMVKPYYYYYDRSQPRDEYWCANCNRMWLAPDLDQDRTGSWCMRCGSWAPIGLMFCGVCGLGLSS